MSPQRGISAADNQILHPHLLRHLVHTGANLLMGLCGLFHGEATGVGENKEQLILLRKSIPDAL